MTQVQAIDTTRISQARQSILQDFFNVDDVVQRLDMFVAMNTIEPLSGNVIFYGKGGYGKTEMAYNYLKTATGTEPFVVNMNQATTPADMYGGIDIPTFANQGRIEYNIENSFMDHEWVIFEEGLEPRQKVLSSLKHIISSRIFTLAGTGSNVPIKTRGIVIVTNIDTADFMDSEDTKAFLERFPIRYRVGWEGLNHSQRYNASLKVVGKFDKGYQIQSSYRQLIAENASMRLESPRMIARVVQALLAHQSMNGGGTVCEPTFTFVMGMMGFGDKNLSAKIEQERIEAEIREAKAEYETLFEQLKKNMAHYQGLKDNLNEPRFIIRMTKQIISTMKVIDQIKDAVIDIRTNPNYGNKGNELASWINTQVGGFSDQLDELKHETWDGLILTVERLVEKIESEGITL